MDSVTSRAEVAPEGSKKNTGSVLRTRTRARRWIESVSRSRPALELALLLAFAVFRLYLTADRDIAAWNAPHDEFWYVHKAYIGVWAGNYSEMSFAHLPVYALWLELLNTYGVPARLGIELAWIAAVFYLATSVRNFAGSRIAGVLITAFLLLHPYSIYIFDRALAETLLAVTVAIATAAALELWVRRDEPLRGRKLVVAMLFSGMFAVSCNLRKEGISLIFPLLFVCALTAFYRGRWWKGAARGAACPGNLLFALPLIATLILGWSISSLNYVKWGTFATDDLDNPGYKSAIAALAAVDVGTTPAKVSITRRMLAHAYELSPTLRELQPQMEGVVQPLWTNPSTSIGARGEIGTGWFYWALRDAAARTGWHSSAKLAEQKYGNVAAELNRAFAQNRLKRRRNAGISFLDPDIQKWIPEVPAAVRKEVRLSLLPRPSDFSLPLEDARPDQIIEYVRAVGRRSRFGDLTTDRDAHLADASAFYLARVSQVIGLLFVLAVISGVLAALLRRRIDPWVIAVGICAVFYSSRIAVFALLDASSWNGEQARYMLPLLPFLACAGGLSLAALPAMYRRERLRPLPAEPTDHPN